MLLRLFVGVVFLLVAGHLLASSFNGLCSGERKGPNIAGIVVGVFIWFGGWVIMFLPKLGIL